MTEKEDNAKVSKQINGAYGFFLLIIGFSVVCGSLISKGISWVLPGLILLIVGYWSVCKADIKPDEKKQENNH